MILKFYHAHSETDSWSRQNVSRDNKHVKYILTTQVSINAQRVYSCKYVKHFILVLLLINYCSSFPMNNCKPTFAPFCICQQWAIYYSVFKKKKILPFATTWMKPEDIMLSEVSQSQKEKHHMIPHMWGI